MSDKKQKRTLNNIPASEWGPSDSLTLLGQLLRTLDKAPVERRDVILSMLGQEVDIRKLRRSNNQLAQSLEKGVAPVSAQGALV